MVLSVISHELLIVYDGEDIVGGYAQEGYEC